MKQKKIPQKQKVAICLNVGRRARNQNARKELDK